MVKKLFLVLTVMAVAFTSCESPMMEDMTATPELAANKEKKPKKPKKLLVAQLDVEAEENSSETRAYDADLVWHWEYGDALKGYQVAYDNIRNRVAYDPVTGLFSCADFTYQSSAPERFHFIYPSGAEVENGVLKAVQDGVWRPVSVFTTGATKIDALPKLQFEQLSSALELRIWSNENNAMQQQVVSAVLTADSDFVGRWTLDPEAMTYTQDLNGKEMVINDINKPVFQVNMPHLPEGYDDNVEIKLVLTRADGRTCTTYLPQELTFVKQKRTIYNLIFVPDPVFTCATYNVKCLPELIGGTSNKNVKYISQKIAASGWDFVAFQEEFEHFSTLTSYMGMYNFGEHRGTVGLENAVIQADTDGLEFATLGATCSWSNQTFVEFTKKHGGLFDGANTCIKKGFRYYLVTMKDDGVQFDVYVTHMNSGSSDKHIDARASQFQQLANYINNHRSGRPIIIMGDFNARYTRDDYKTNFWDFLNTELSDNLQDAWAELIWGGDYPEYGTGSWMVADEYDASSDRLETDIRMGEQEGEVVDKILYINDPQSDVRIWAKSYKRAMDFDDLSDHNPVVVQFGYEKVK